MAFPISPVVPPSIDRAKKVAKQLHEIYPHFQLSKLQEVTAKLMFWDDWHALTNAVKSDLIPGPFDEDISEGELKERVREQSEILFLQMHKPLPFNDRHNPDTDSTGFKWSIKLAVEAIYEVSPTARKAVTRKIGEEIFLVSPNSKWMSTLPQRLAKWWRLNVEDQTIVADTLEGFKLNVDRKTSILRLGQYWGALCKAYAQVIPMVLTFGIAYILGQRFAMLELYERDDFQQFLSEKLENCSEDDFKKLISPWIEAQLNLAINYFEVYPIEEIKELYIENHQGFMEAGSKAFSLLTEQEDK
ncbi:hypothetical protein [Methylophilus sp. QUAN]|uniref:hypothetical protein n=1 Tax=Methylophilus sp. QUAN TaxID=2781020 RepID=UPI00188F9E52|nr:hypothetical protein [Methylophilus sp. QUAN]MBF4991120.1 hypothetical protein [Methylophilus sp. QUAN]